MMGRYLVFAGHFYYPSGGWDDFKGSFDSLKDAKKQARDTFDKGCDWYHVVDSVTQRIVTQDTN